MDELTKRTLIMIPISAALGFVGSLLWVMLTSQTAEATGGDDTLFLVWLAAVVGGTLLTAGLGPICYRARWFRFGPAVPGAIGLILGWIADLATRTSIRPAIVYGALAGIAIHFVFAIIAGRFAHNGLDVEPARTTRSDAAQAVGVAVLAAIIVTIGGVGSARSQEQFEERAAEVFDLSEIATDQETWVAASSYQNGVCADLRRLESAHRNSADLRDQAEAVAARFEADGFTVIRFDIPTFQAIDAHRVIRAQDGTFGVEIDLRDDETAFTIIESGNECDTLFRSRNGLLQEGRFTVDTFN